MKNLMNITKNLYQYYKVLYKKVYMKNNFLNKYFV